MNSIYFVAQFITFFRKAESQKSRTTWVQWREIVQEIYREKHFQSKIKLIINSGTADSSKLKTIEEYTGSFQLFKDEDKKEIIELIQLYQELLKREKEIILADRFEIFMQKLTATVDKQILDSIPETVKQWITNKEEDKFYFKIKLEGTLQIIIADFLLRLSASGTLKYLLIRILIQQKHNRECFLFFLNLFLFLWGFSFILILEISELKKIRRKYSLKLVEMISK